MDSEPVTARSLSRTYIINANTFERAYKDTLSGFSTWQQKDHAGQWVLKPENIGPRVGIDETSFCHELYTIVHNKDATAGRVPSLPSSGVSILRMSQRCC